jgi:hypothetical protein
VQHLGARHIPSGKQTDAFEYKKGVKQKVIYPALLASWSNENSCCSALPE